MFAGNSARTGVFAGRGLDLQREVGVLWQIDGAQTGSLIEPLGVCDGVVFYRPVPDGVSNEIKPVIALDVHTGNVRWTADPPSTEPTTFFWGKPVIADGLFVMPTYSGLLVGLDTLTGAQLWTFDMQGQAPDSGPAIVDDVMYVSDAASVNAIHLGFEPEWLWKTALADGEVSVLSGTVTVDDDHIVVSSVGQVTDDAFETKSTTIHVLDRRDGSEAYRFQFAPLGESLQFALQDEILYSRTVRESGGGPRPSLYSTTVDGAERWRVGTSVGAFPSYPVVGEDLVYAATYLEVWALDAGTGEMIWTSTTPHPLKGNIALIDGVLLVGAESERWIFALDPETGDLVKSIEVPYNGAEVIGATDGVLIARTGTSLVALHNV